MKITNPATGSVIADVAADNPGAVRRKYEAARAGQQRWANVPIRKRLAAIAGFRERIVASQENLARTLTEEVGKPIRQSRNELNGLLGRIDFFLQESARALREEKVYSDGNKMDERITHEPLGVVANISAWNYPYFVGSNVFVPALVAGNAVLYKPSEFATLTGLSIAEMLHESGVPRDVFVPVIGDGATGAALTRQPVDGIFFTGSYATGKRIAASAGQRMIKVQLELGGKDPVYVREDVDVKAAAAAVADGAFYNTGQSCCSVERIYVHESIHDAFVAAFVAEVKGYKMGDPMDESTYVGAITRKPQLAVLKGQVKDAKKKGAEALARRQRRRSRQRQLVRADGVHRRRPFDGADEGRELRPDHRHPGRCRRRGRDRPHERHRLRSDRERLHGRRQARAQNHGAAQCRQRLLELLRSREPAAAVVGRGPLGNRPHAVDLRDTDVHAAEGVAFARGVTLEPCAR
jgi:acyl-CoA reductase-like NAD-dependent aldehyde dehydrogenase